MPNPEENKRFLPENPAISKEDVEYSDVPLCPECDDFLIISGRCKTCHNCGWSSCDL